jgi:hypothetical protein
LKILCQAPKKKARIGTSDPCFFRSIVQETETAFFRS